MKKIVCFWLLALCLPIGLMAQSVDDDLYFVPSKNKQEKKETPVRKEPTKQVTNIYTSPGTTVVVKDRKGRTRDVDEYNRRYDALDNEFVMDNDTLYIKEKANPDLDGEWVTGEFNGTQEDYEYAERIIRFRNPRFAVSISSPLYWDMVYGPNSWNWNVYTDGMYAYVFPTFSNPLWWDWRYGSYNWGWNYGWGWNRPYYAWGYYPGYWGGWHGGYWGHHHHHWPTHGWGWGGGNYWANNSYTNRRSYAPGRYNSSISRRSDYSRSQVRRTTSVPSGSRVSTGRVVGSRSESTRPGVTRSDASSTRRSTYTRPSSTRSSVSGSRTSTRTSTRSGSTSPLRTYSRDNNNRNSNYNSSRSSSSSSRSYSPASSSSRSSGSSYSGGGSSSSRSGGGSSSRSSRR
ncbi:hypothetical protein [uncultured Bacteroides sp.]|uniref:hypothetical protein n=1 Tax=uncultured Bacteroides sp. TaxID=162156 RepID=UPI0025EBF803|nr:hypothetical protein [uncultured Bacteroides sp.]